MSQKFQSRKELSVLLIGIEHIMKKTRAGQKVLVLNYEFPPLGGGASPVSYEIAKAYAKLGHKVDVITMSYKGLPSFEQKDGINIFRVSCWRSKKEVCSPLEQLTYIRSAKKFLKKHLKTQSYDINHTHFIIPTGVLSIWLKKKYGLPYIITSHGSDVPGYNTDRFVFLHKFTGPLLRKICEEAETIIALSDYLKGLIEQSIGRYGEEKLIKIPNGIDADNFVPLNKEKILLSTGRLLPRKGFQYLIKAVSGEDVGYVIHICGDGPMMQELRELASRSKTKIVFHGWVSNESEEYRELLGKASVYCLVSLKENASISLLEAMSAGCAIITSNFSGCPETVGESGIIVDPENIDELRAAIISLVNDPVKGEKLGIMARNRILNIFQWPRIIEEYNNLFISSQGKSKL